MLTFYALLHTFAPFTVMSMTVNITFLGGNWSTLSGNTVSRFDVQYFHVRTPLTHFRSKIWEMIIEYQSTYKCLFMLFDVQGVKGGLIHNNFKINRLIGLCI